jgi:hypothetical protein
MNALRGWWDALWREDKDAVVMAAVGWAILLFVVLHGAW